MISHLPHHTKEASSTFWGPGPPYLGEETEEGEGEEVGLKCASHVTVSPTEPALSLGGRTCKSLCSGGCEVTPRHAHTHTHTYTPGPGSTWRDIYCPDSKAQATDSSLQMWAQGQGQATGQGRVSEADRKHPGSLTTVIEAESGAWVPKSCHLHLRVHTLVLTSPSLWVPQSMTWPRV